MRLLHTQSFWLAPKFSWQWASRLAWCRYRAWSSQCHCRSVFANSWFLAPSLCCLALSNYHSHFLSLEIWYVVVGLGGVAAWRFSVWCWWCWCCCRWPLSGIHAARFSASAPFTKWCPWQCVRLIMVYQLEAFTEWLRHISTCSYS